MFKWYRTKEEWEVKGFKVAAGVVSRVKNSFGQELFSWGQVIPTEYSDKSELDPHDPDNESDGCIF